MSGEGLSEPRDCVGCGNTTPMLTDERGRMTCPICGHVILAEDDAEPGVAVRAKPARVRRRRRATRRSAGFGRLQGLAQASL